MQSGKLLLTTPVVSRSDGQEISVIASFKPHPEFKSYFLVNLVSQSNLTVFGDMYFYIREKENDKKDKYLFIVNMRNTSFGYKHVGTALHEFAFRFSVACGAEGRVELDAVRDTHFMHYLCGFRSTFHGDFRLKYYLNLAGALLRTGRDNRIREDVGSETLSLPPSTIVAKLEKFKLNCFPELKLMRDDEEYEHVEKLVDEAFRKSFAATLIVALSEGLGFHDLSIVAPKEGRVFRPARLRKRTPGEYCSVTNEILSYACERLCQLLPLDSDAKKTQFDIVLIGAMVCAMTIQDSTYGAQERFNNQLLFPSTSSDDISRLVPSDDLLETFQYLGTAILVNKSISFDAAWCGKVFGRLGVLSEFAELLGRHGVSAREEKKCTL